MVRLALNDAVHRQIIGLLEQAKARNTTVIAVTTEGS